MATPLDVAKSSLVALIIFNLFSYHNTALLQYYSNVAIEGKCTSLLPSPFLSMGFGIFFGEYDSLISVKYHLFIFP
jgi:hypothetical protein